MAMSSWVIKMLNENDKEDLMFWQFILISR